MDIATVTKHLERSMQNCSSSNRRRSLEDGIGIRYQNEEDHIPISGRTLELNSHISLPSHLEQCLDLKTGEISYINRKNGMRVKEEPRTSVVTVSNYADDFSGESDVTLFSEEDSSLYYESEESSSESPSENLKEEEEEEVVLVVAGCKACYMYFMVPKLLKDCPKCSAQLLHFDRPHSASP
ncbi:hypothetical protein N665_1305s0013 [Sinapis alba]|nr:hypothetical protein N665_1305s0013 [Sinapis alba]